MFPPFTPHLENRLSPRTNIRARLFPDHSPSYLNEEGINGKNGEMKRGVFQPQATTACILQTSSRRGVQHFDYHP